jgi:hypothetical protein
MRFRYEGFEKNIPEGKANGYVFYSVRNAKMQALIAHLQSLLSKKGFNFEVRVDPKSITFRLFNKKENSWEYVDTYIWLKAEHTHISREEYSRWFFVDSNDSLRTHFGSRLPTYVDDFWTELETLYNNGFFKSWINELNYPFNNERIVNENIDITKALLSHPEDFLSVAIEEGNKAGRIIAVNYLESELAKKGFICDGVLNGDSMSFVFKNTKRGKWTEATMNIQFEVEKRTYEHAPEVEDNVPQNPRIVVTEPNDKATKHYDNFIEYVGSQEFEDAVDNAIKSLYYPYNTHSHFKC